MLSPEEPELELDFESDLESEPELGEDLSDDFFLPDLESPSDSDFEPLDEEWEDEELSLRYQPLPLKWRAAAEILRREGEPHAGQAAPGASLKPWTISNSWSFSSQR